MQVLADTNVVLDLLLAREPWFSEASSFWSAVDDDRVSCAISATSLTNIFYIVRRLDGLTRANAAVRRCLSTFSVYSVDVNILERASRMAGSDFEDNVQIACAIAASADAIITRDDRGFQVAPIPVYTPSDLAALL